MKSWDRCCTIGKSAVLGAPVRPVLRLCATLTVGEDDGLELDLRLRDVAVLSGQHVHLALVHAQLADVRLRARGRERGGMIW